MPQPPNEDPHCGRLQAFQAASPDLTCVISRAGYYLDVASGVDVPAVTHPENIIGKKVVEVGTREYGEKTLALALRAMDTGEMISWDFEIPQRPDVSYQARFARSGPDECLVLVRDVSDVVARQALEAAVAARTDQLQLSNDELRQFAYAASHDLREPLLKVKAFGTRLKEKHADNLDAKGHQYLDVMLNATERMQLLMDDLLSYSRVGRVGEPFEVVDLNDVVRGVLSDLAIPIAKVGAHIQVGLLPDVAADRIQMRTVFQNLISNSLKFHHPDRQADISISASASEGDFVIEVRDNGIGFDMKFKEKIFQLFERLHTRFNYPGTGIGLALCKKIIDRHQGWIDCESIPGTGATFFVGLPRNVA